MSPSRRLLVALAALALLALVIGVMAALQLELATSLQPVWWGLLLALLATALFDVYRLRRLPTPEVQRSLSGSLPLGHWSPVQLTVSNRQSAPLELELFDHVPPGMSVEQLPQRVSLQSGEYCLLAYRVQPNLRGQVMFQRCDVRLLSPLGLWRSRRPLTLHSETRVYPDFAQLHGAGLKAIDLWLNRLGVRQQPRRGLGLEFHQLREFREGDTLRQIDWKATARARTPIAREYQDSATSRSC